MEAANLVKYAASEIKYRKKGKCQKGVKKTRKFFSGALAKQKGVLYVCNPKRGERLRMEEI